MRERKTTGKLTFFKFGCPCICSCLVQILMEEWSQISQISFLYLLLYLLFTGGGGGFFLMCEDFGRMFNSSFPACVFFFFFKVEISSRTLIPLFWPESVQSGSTNWDDCDWVFPDSLCVSSFPDRFPHYALAFITLYSIDCMNGSLAQLVVHPFD